MVKRIVYWVADFALPICIVALVCTIVGIYPFGEQSFLISDLRFQYIDFFAWLQQVLTGGTEDTNLFYSTSQGLGTNMVGLYSYYLASPFNLLLLLFDENSLAEFALVTMFLKVGCIQLAMTFYLMRRFSLGGIWSCVIALGFTLSMWTITQARNPMWLDGLIFLPLIAWGMYCLIKDGKWRLFTLMLACSVISCWYMAYMTVVFIFLFWFVEEYALEIAYQNKGDICALKIFKKSTRKRFFVFIGSMLFSLCLAAFIFFPTICNMLEAGSVSVGQSSFDMVEEVLQARGISFGVLVACGIAAVAVCVVAIGVIRKYSLRRKLAVALLCLLVLCLVLCLVIPKLQHGSLSDVIYGLFGGWVDSKTPQLYGNIAILVGAIAFFCTSKVSKKMKLAAGLFLFLLILSSWLRPFEFVWAGFRIPYGYHSRMSFCAIFFMAWLCAYVVQKLDVSKSDTGKADVADAPDVPDVADVSKITDAPDTPKTATIQLLVAKLVHAISVNKAVGFVAILLVSLDVVVRMCVVWSGMYAEIEQSTYDARKVSLEQQIIQLEEDDPSVYRIDDAQETESGVVLNDAISLGFDTIASYSSTADQAVLAMLSELGYGDGEFRTYDYEPTILGEALFGVKYVLADEMPDGYVSSGVAPSEDGLTAFRNPNALSLAYAVSDDICDLTLADLEEPDPLISQFMLKYSDINESTQPEGASGNALNVLVSAMLGEETRPFVLTGPDESFVSVASRKEAQASDSAPDSASENTSGNTSDANASLSSSTKLEYLIDVGILRDVTEKLRSHEFVFERFSNGIIAGSIDMGQDVEGKVLLMTIPNQNGWNVFVNDIPVEPLDAVQGALMAIPITDGVNVIRMEFVPPGLAFGCIVSLASLGFLVGVSALLGKSRRRFSLIDLSRSQACC